MKKENFIRNIIKLSNIRIIKILLELFENILFYYYKKKFQNAKKLDSKFFSFLQLFFNAKISALYRRRKHDILINSLNQSSDLDRKIAELTNNSFTKIFELNSLDINTVIKYFYSQNIYTTHVPNNPDWKNSQVTTHDFINNDDPTYNYASYTIETSLNCDVIKKFCLSKEIWKIAKKYLYSNDIKIYSINTMLSKKAKIQAYPTKLHVDFDSTNSLVFFVYWTDVSKFNGSTKLLPGSHLFLFDKNLKSYVNEDSIKFIEGKAGSVFALDPWALHAGNTNINHPRLVTWIRFTSFPARSYYLDCNYLYKDKINEINNTMNN